MYQRFESSQIPPSTMQNQSIQNTPRQPNRQAAQHQPQHQQHSTQHQPQQQPPTTQHHPVRQPQTTQPAQPSQHPQSVRQSQTMQHPQAAQHSHPIQQQPLHQPQPVRHQQNTELPHTHNSGEKASCSVCKASHQESGKKSGISGLLQKLLPDAVYNKQTKKFFGIIGAEDLLLLALIFLFMEKDDEENSALILALLFVLVSDYIDLSGFNLQDFGI